MRASSWLLEKWFSFTTLVRKVTFEPLSERTRRWARTWEDSLTWSDSVWLEPLSAHRAAGSTAQAFSSSLDMLQLFLVDCCSNRPLAGGALCLSHQSPNRAQLKWEIPGIMLGHSTESLIIKHERKRLFHVWSYSHQPQKSLNYASGSNLDGAWSSERSSCLCGGINEQDRLLQQRKTHTQSHKSLLI